MSGWGGGDGVFASTWSAKPGKPGRCRCEMHIECASILALAESVSLLGSPLVDLF